MTDSTEAPQTPAEPAVARAEELGHTMEWDPPAALTAVRRWTCSRYGGTALDNRGHIYGDAIEKTCDEVKAYWAGVAS